MQYNYHTHTTRCRHAVGSEREYIERAIESGYKIFGFSDHSPYVFENGYYSTYRMYPDEVEDYFNTLLKLRDEYKGQIEIPIGLEAEYYPRFFDRFIELITPYKPDFLILGQHFILNEMDGYLSFEKTTDRRRLSTYVSQVIEGMDTGRFTYVAHPDVLQFTGDREVYKEEMRKICVRARQLDMPLELNLLGVSDHRHYPARAFWEIVSEEGCRVVLGLDAHRPEAIGREDVVRRAEDFLLSCGIKIRESALELRTPV